MKTITAVCLLLASLTPTLHALDTPDPAFVAKVEAAMSILRRQRLEEADREWADMANKIKPQQPQNDRDRKMFSLFGLLSQELIALRFIPSDNGTAVAIKLTSEEIANSLAEQMPFSAVVIGSWLLFDPDDRDRSGVRELQLVLGTRRWDQERKAWVPPPTADESEAAKTKRDEKASVGFLRSGVLPSQIQFQAGSYFDPDNNGQGSFGFINEFCGAPIPNCKRTLQFLKPEYNSPTPAKDGWSFFVFLPGKDIASGVGSRAEVMQLALDEHRVPAGEGLRERHFVAYACPSIGNTGTMYAITENRIVYHHVWTGVKPAWDSLWALGGEPWSKKTGEGWIEIQR